MMYDAPMASALKFRVHVRFTDVLTAWERKATLDSNVAHMVVNTNKA
jgi:hypothetical protein